MSGSAQEIRAKIGTALSDSEMKAVDPAKVGKMEAQPKKAAVEGQAYLATQVCPYCGCVGYGVESETQYLYFTCHCCGMTFRA